MAQFAALGVKVKVETDESQAEDVYEVWRSNWQSVRAFLACETQWRVAVGFGGVVMLGIDYAAADMVLTRRGGDRHRRARRRAERIFEDLRVMEAAALEAFNEANE